jgi:hypothetical protein
MFHRGGVHAYTDGVKGGRKGVGLVRWGRIRCKERRREIRVRERMVRMEWKREGLQDVLLKGLHMKESNEERAI